MNANPINPKITLGTVALTVSSFAQSLPFYQERIGLILRRQEENIAYLSTTEWDLLVLYENREAQQIQAQAGLYHFALLLSSRLELAKILSHLLATETAVQGLADHFVSEAIYLTDPDGNGIEIYRDRPRDQWDIQQGTVQIGTVALDVEGVLGELDKTPSPWSGLDAATQMGHIHLQVANLDREEAFYKDILGFDLITRYGTAASFLSAGGYHHHIGINTWSRAGKVVPPANATGLRWYTIQFPTQAALNLTLANLQSADIPFVEQSGGLFLSDPSQNGILLAVRK